MQNIQFFAFNLENFTPDRIFYTGAACGACDKYEVWSYVDDNNDDYVKYTLQLSWFTVPGTRPEPDPEPGLLTITKVKKCYLSGPAYNAQRSIWSSKTDEWILTSGSPAQKGGSLSLKSLRKHEAFSWNLSEIIKPFETFRGTQFLRSPNFW